jgi:hypothetical protein
LHLEPYAKSQARRRRSTIDSLEKKSQVVDSKLCSNPNDSNLLIEKHNLANLLADYYNDVHEAAKLKASVKHAVDGERATSFFSA